MGSYSSGSPGSQLRDGGQRSGGLLEGPTPGKGRDVVRRGQAWAQGRAELWCRFRGPLGALWLGDPSELGWGLYTPTPASQALGVPSGEGVWLGVRD